MEDNARILVVEDSPTQVVAIQYLLERNHYQVFVAPDGQKALELLETIKPTIIITDIMMPGMNGYELCRTIKNDDRFKDIPVILLTSLSDPDDVINGLVCGANNFIVKPYEENFLLSRIKYVLANQEIRRCASSQMGIEILFRGKSYFLNSERVQMIDLLLSTYEVAIQRNHEYQDANEELKKIKNELEMRVKERTAELSAANIQLMKEIEERTLAEEALRKSEMKYQDLYNSAPVAYFSVSADGRIIGANNAAEAFTGWPREELLKMKVNDLYAKESIPRAGELFEQFRQGKGFENEEMIYLRKDGKKAYGLLSVSPIMALNGQVIEARSIVNDITEHKKLEEQFHQAMKMEAVGRLAGGVAHDFNNALTPILGISEILLNEFDTGHPMYEDLEEISKSAERCAGLTRQLLTFGRRQPLEMTVLNLNGVVTNMERMLSRVIGEDIDLVKFPDPDLWNVKADAGQMEQILANLAVNSRDAMPNGGKLTIETANIVLDEENSEEFMGASKGPYVMLAVSDTGIGISRELRSKIFEPFFTTKEIGKGTGLGLSTVYGIVKQSGGCIWCYSEPGKGTTFKIYLPRVDSEAETLKKRDPDRLEIRPGSETILLVEDDKNVRKVARRILSGQGYTILEAANGDEALRVIREYQGHVHLMITDVVMPGMSGKELAEQFTGLRPDMKVIFISGYTDNAIVHHGVLNTGIHFLQKPFTAKTLIGKVREVLYPDEVMIA